MGVSSYAVISGVLLAFVGVILVLGRYEIIVDGRERTLTRRLGLGALRGRWSHSLKGIDSVRVKQVWASGKTQEGTQPKLKLTGRDGADRFYYEVWLAGGGKELCVYSFSLGGAQSARELAQELAALLRLRRVEELGDTDDSSPAGGDTTPGDALS